METFSFGTCDWIGFDLDHTLVRYKLGPMHALIFRALVQHMVHDLGFPAAWLQWIYDEDFAVKGVVLDIERGNLFKMSADMRVHVAYHGLTPMSPEEIQEIYPDPVDVHDTPTPQYRPLITFFDVPAIYLVGIMVDRVDRGECASLHDYKSVWEAIYSGFEANFAHFDKGYYFPEVAANTYKYIFKRTEVKQWMHKLHAHGIRTFLATNSHTEYAILLLEYSFGEDWRSMFDLILYDAAKPAFFNARPPFRRIEANGAARIEMEEEISSKELEYQGEYCRGNWMDCQEAIIRIDAERGRTRACEHYPQVVYFGDHIRSDVMAVARHTTWIPGAIVEEMELSPFKYDSLDLDTASPAEQEEDPPFEFDPTVSFHRKYIPMPVSRQWGSFLHIDTPSGRVESYWSYYIRTHCDCALVIPCLSALVHLDLHTTFTMKNGIHHIYHRTQQLL